MTPHVGMRSLRYTEAMAARPIELRTKHELRTDQDPKSCCGVTFDTFDWLIVSAPSLLLQHYHPPTGLDTTVCLDPTISFESDPYSEQPISTPSNSQPSSEPGRLPSRQRSAQQRSATPSTSAELSDHQPSTSASQSDLPSTLPGGWPLESPTK
jgi:hypothetical protein